MKVILLERVERLGAIGDTVTVKDGFARNFLLPRNKALRATSQNQKVFEAQRAQIEQRNADARAEAERGGEKLDGSTFILIRQAGESGQLYGSVSARDVAEAAQAAQVEGAPGSNAPRSCWTCRSRRWASTP
jgi:large subunit ribosomal protein L9